MLKEELKDLITSRLLQKLMVQKLGQHASSSADFTGTSFLYSARVNFKFGKKSILSKKPEQYSPKKQGWKRGRNWVPHSKNLSWPGYFRKEFKTCQIHVKILNVLLEDRLMFQDTIVIYIDSGKQHSTLLGTMTHLA